MPANMDQHYIDLLKNNPRQLILSLQELINTIVLKFIKTGYFNTTEKEDLRQQINEELLKKIPRLQVQFNGKSTLKTYLSAVISNICYEILRSKRKKNNNLIKEQQFIHNGNEVLNAFVIKEELETLKNAIELYYRHKPKLILFLQLKYRIPVSLFDFKKVYSNITFLEYEEFLQMTKPYETATDFKIYSALAYVLKKTENKEITADAIRKWIKQKIDELIEILNGDPPVSNYNEETLQILFEKYFHNQNEIPFIAKVNYEI